MKFMYRPVKFNFSSRQGNKISWLVIHDTGNPSKGADAEAHRRFFSEKRKSSAHYFVDDKQIIQIIGDSQASWHCGDNQGKGRALNGCKNTNSIGIELCINQDGDYDKAYKNLVELVKNLMVKFKIDLDHVCRHYDVSRKRCPGTFFDRGLWTKFKEDIGKPIKWVIDLSKDSQFGPGVVKKEDKPMTSWGDEEYKKAVDLGITDGTNPDQAATRKEVACMIVRALSLKDKAPEVKKNL